MTELVKANTELDTVRVAQPELMEDARIGFKNFAGHEGPYNRAGDRNFCVFLDEIKAQELASAGWNVKQTRTRPDGTPGDFYIQISIGFGKGRPPRLVLISSAGRTELGEAECEMLDWVDIAKVDLIFRPYNWNVNGKTGVKAYLKSLYITMNEDYLELKYNEVPLAVEGANQLAIESGSQTPDDRIVIEGRDDDIIIEADEY